MLKKSSAGGRAELAKGRIVGMGQDALEEKCRGRGGDGQDTVRAAHRAAAHVHGGGHYLVRAKLADQEGDGRDVRHRVERADLVEVHLADGAAVRAALGVGQEAIYGLRMSLRRRGHVKPGHDLQHVIEGMMLVVMIVVVMRVVVILVMMSMMMPLLLSVHMHMEERAGDAAALDPFGGIHDAGDA